MTESAGGQQSPPPGVAKKVRRGLGGWWILALILVPLAIATLATITRHGAIQDKLMHRSQAVLQQHHVPGVDVTFSGRDAEVSVPAGVDTGRVEHLVMSVPGVRDVTIESEAS